MTASSAPSPTASRPSLSQRLGAFTYESVLLFGVVFFVSAVVHTAVPDVDGNPWPLRAVLFVALGSYFTFCWTRTGQTLALKAWQIRVVSENARLPSWRTAILRYIASWTLVLPGLVAVSLTSARGLGAMLVFGAGVLLMLAPALLNRDGKLLHDWLARTRIERLPPAAATKPG
jgi:uncharacterized RDD family membrane protein YckC